MKQLSIEEKYILIKEELLKSTSTNPIEICRNTMHKDFVSIHGPEHHFIDGGSLLTAIKNSGVEINLSEALDKLAERSIKMPGAMCGRWGVCGSCTSIGAALSIIHDVGPLTSNEYYSDDMEFTSSVIQKMSKIGGPRCCKRNAFLSLSGAIEFLEKKYQIILGKENIVCEFSLFNEQCIKEKCPFNSKKQ